MSYGTYTFRPPPRQPNAYAQFRHNFPAGTLIPSAVEAGTPSVPTGFNRSFQMRQAANYCYRTPSTAPFHMGWRSHRYQIPPVAGAATTNADPATLTLTGQDVTASTGGGSGAVTYLKVYDTASLSAGRVVAAGPTGYTKTGDYTTAAFSTTAGQLLVACIRYDWQDANITANIPTPVTSGLTWVKKAEAFNTGTNSSGIQIWMADNPSGGSITVSQTRGDATNWESNTNAIDLTVLECTGALALSSQTATAAAEIDPSGSPRTPTNIDVGGLAAMTTGDLVVAVAACDVGTTTTITNGSGWTEQSDIPAAMSGADGTFLRSQVQTRTGSTSATVAWADLGDNVYDYAMAAVTVLAGVASGPSADSATITLTGVDVTASTSGGAQTVNADVAVLTLTARTPRTSPVPYAYPATISGRKILDQNGQVYPARTMSSWSLSSHLSNANITAALESVAAFGFNGVTVWNGGTENNGSGWDVFGNTVTGQSFWTGTPYGSALGPAWVTVDWMMSEAARLGLTVHFSFCHGNTGGCPGPYWDAVTNTDMYNVGVAIANRYSGFSNIVWHVMFDMNLTPSSTRGQKINSLFEGINATEGASARPVRWTEVENGQSTTQQGWYNPAGTGGATTGDQTRFSINCMYSYDSDSVADFETRWTETTGPTGDCEPPYVGAGHYTGNENQQLRERNYGVFIEGGCLINYGHEAWWPFGATPLFSTGMTWTDVFGGTSTQTAPQTQAMYCWAFIDAYLRDTAFAPTSGFVTTGEGTGDTKAAQGVSTTKAVAYFPDDRTVVVDTTVITASGNVQLRWFDPVANSYSLIAASEAKQTGRSVTLPAARTTPTAENGTRDYVLLVETVATLTADVATITLTAVAVTAAATGTVTVAADPATVTLFGQDVTPTGTGTATVSADPALLTLFGVDVGSGGGAVTNADIAAVTLAGQDVTVTGTGTATTTADVAAVTLTGQDTTASGTGTTTTAADVAAVTLTGQDVTVFAPGSAAAGPATLTLVGQTPTVSGSGTVIRAADPAIITLFGVTPGEQPMVALITCRVTGAALSRRITGPSNAPVVSVTGPSNQPVSSVTGPALRRSLTGPGHLTRVATGPGIETLRVTGPDVRRDVTGPGREDLMAVTGPGVCDGD